MNEQSANAEVATEKLRGYRVGIKGGHQSVWCKDRAEVLQVLDDCVCLFDLDQTSAEVLVTIEYTTKAELDALGDWQGF
jgi:hypothetical protein